LLKLVHESQDKVQKTQVRAPTMYRHKGFRSNPASNRKYVDLSSM